MLKKIYILIMCLVVLTLSGCSAEKRIDKASIAETVTVTKQQGKTVYTYFVLDSSDKPSYTAIEADSFKQSQLLAKEKYIPDLSLAKLELIAFEDNVYLNDIKADITYITGQPDISPRTNITLCDKLTAAEFKQTKDITEDVLKRISELKKNYKSLKTDALSVFNSLAASSGDDLYVSYINSNKELNASPTKIL